MTETTETKVLFERARAEIGKVVVSSGNTVDLLLIAMLCEGHVLLEGPPGTAKTLLIRTLSRVLDLENQRIQFTPDLMPADILGNQILDLETNRFHLRRGPIFTDLLLADEINRAPAKTQSALLQAMMEGQVTIDRESLALGDFFLVCATQNPIEMEGTYPLPEAQLDRFLFKIDVDYPDEQDEVMILERHHISARSKDLDSFGLEIVADREALLRARKEIDAVTVRREVVAYVTKLARRTREHPSLVLGASTRGALMVLVAAKAWAAREGRDFVTPDDVKAVARPAIRHRLQLHPAALIEGVSPDDIVTEILQQTEVPR
ncbi:MAG: MoxR-like ATPase [Bacteroidia bacterium]|jgi:MoxR-like ATPase